MQLVKTHDNFVSHGVQEHKDYVVVSNVKMMDMLSDGLYQDKVKAVIRELSTNAWDSHVLAGRTDTPFDLQLPSYETRVFRIRDYGTGMPPEKVLDMYRKYGVSDKAGDNEAQGCLGLGSKSPFAYTRQFTSISYYEGIKYIFINAKDERGKPTINLMSSDLTTEPNGFEVSFVTHEHDSGEFRDKAAKVLRAFPLLPKFICVDGNSAPTITKYEAILEGDDWAVLATNRYDAYRSMAIMGYVEYPIDWEQFKENTSQLKDRRVPSWYNGSGASKYINLLRAGIALKFNIGEIEMDISREALQYHEYTIEAIKRKLDKICVAIRDKVLALLTDCTNLWDARCTWNKLRVGPMRQLSRLLELDTQACRWGGQELSGGISPSATPGTKVVSFVGDKTHCRRSGVCRIEACGTTQFYVNDMKRGAYAACMRKVASHNGTTDRLHINLLTFEDTKAKDTFLKMTGIPEDRLVYCSTLPKPKRVKRSKQQKQQVFIFKPDNTTNTHGPFRQYQGLQAASRWEPSTIDNDTFNKGGVYVEINSWHPRDAKGRGSCSELVGNMSNVNNFRSGDLPIVYGIKTVAIEKFQKASNWISVFDWIVQEVKAYVAKSNISEAIALDSELNDVADTYQDLWDYIIKYVHLPSNVAKDICELGRVFEDRQQRRNKLTVGLKYVRCVISSMCDDMKIDTWVSPTGYQTLSQMANRLAKKYTMLTHINAYSMRWESNSEAMRLREAVSEYIIKMNP